MCSFRASAGCVCSMWNLGNSIQQSDFEPCDRLLPKSSLTVVLSVFCASGGKGGRGRGRGKGGRGMIRGGRGRNRGRGRGDMGMDDDNNGDMDNGVRLLQFHVLML